MLRRLATKLVLDGDVSLRLVDHASNDALRVERDGFDWLNFGERVSVLTFRADVVRRVLAHLMLVEVGVELLCGLVELRLADFHCADERGLALASANDADSLADIRLERMSDPGLGRLGTGENLNGEVLA